MSERQFQITTRKGPQPGKSYPLVAEQIIVGRDPMSDISLNDPEVSRQHLRFARTESGYTIEDLGSTNGTFIDGEQIEAGEVHPLRNGQIISMGSGVTVIYEASGEAAAADAPVADAAAAWDEVDAPEPERETAVPPMPEPEMSPSLSEPPVTAVPPAQTPLVPQEDSGRAKKRRRNIILAVGILLLLCCCCLVFLYTGYFYWGDPLYEFLIQF